MYVINSSQRFESSLAISTGVRTSPPIDRRGDDDDGDRGIWSGLVGVLRGLFGSRRRS